MTELAREICAACVPGSAALGAAEITELQASLDGAWNVSDGVTLHRRITFKNFADAFAFTTRVALLCEAQGHHADLGVGWGYTEIGLTTHAAAGLTRNDFIVAARIDKITPG